MFAKHGCSGAAGIRLIAKQALFGDYKGGNAHAAANPFDGINALDAAVASYNNISMLRQQIRPDERIHGAFVETPTRPNIIAAHTQVCWESRAPRTKRMHELVKRVT
jgi:metal-dependent amidase/aminoacylase/carboxypeptidase family protein